MKTVSGAQKNFRPFRFGLMAMAVLCMWGPAFPRQGACDEVPGLSVSQILQGIRERYAARDFEAEFIQESHLKAMAIVDTAEGHVYFKPPLAMRWHYRSPEEYMIVSDGRTVWMYRPQDRQVMVGKAGEVFGDTNFADFFAEPERLLERFVIEQTSARQDNKDHYFLRLVPKGKQPNVKEVFLSVSKETFDIVQSDTHNFFGDLTRLRFSDFRFNQGLKSSFFQFLIPEGVDVLEMDNPQ
jgi:outer membrane lipoprotein carrier protein